MSEVSISLPPAKKIYFASDFHLGAPDYQTSLIREKSIVRWLDAIKADAHSIYLMGDIFDFWFEYREAIPKGFIRLQGKLAELRDGGLPISFFTGNHDMWMFDYFPNELGIPIHREPVTLKINDQVLLIGHGDGLGPGDRTYKILKRFFNSSACQWLFARLHPNLGMQIAHYWSKKSRISNMKKGESFQREENEYLLTYCKQLEKISHHNFYIFGYRPIPLVLSVDSYCRNINLREWFKYITHAVDHGMKV